MATFRRLKHTFNSGEVSHLLQDRTDFKRHKNGCKRLHNMMALSQGPATRRSGFQFIYNLNDLGLDTDNPLVRTIPFIFSETEAYAMVFFMHTDGTPRVVFGTGEGLVVSTGTACEFDSEQVRPYTGDGVYTLQYPEGATVNGVTGNHIAADGTVTDIDGNLTLGTPADEEVDVTVAGGPASGGYAYFILDITAAVVTADDVIVLKLPDFDIDNFDWAQVADEVYFAQPDRKPAVIRRYSPYCWELLNIRFSTQPSVWPADETAAELAKGWPERVTFHQQRLVYAGNALKPQTVWMSAAGDFYDFDISADLGDATAVSFTLASGRPNRIQWLHSAKTLELGTLGGEWTVKGTTSTALTPSNILAEKHTNNGSEAVKPQMIGLTSLFVERHGRAVNSYSYDYQFDSYKSTDLSILAPHLTEKFSIVDWSLQQTPHGIVWAVREDGWMISLTYQMEHDVVGWHTHATDGLFKSVTVVPGDTREDDVWVVVERVIEGESAFFVEKLADSFTGTEVHEGRFLDSFVFYEGDPEDEFDLPHLAGKTVSLVLDGQVYPDRTVGIDGSLTLETEAATALIGLAYMSEVRPLVMEVPSTEGSFWLADQRVVELSVDFYRTLGCVAGVEFTDGNTVEEPMLFVEEEDLSDAPYDLFSGVLEFDFMEGYDTKTEFFLKQVQPLPLTVLSIVDKVEVS